MGTGVASDLQLGEHFRLSEFLVSQTAIEGHIPNDSTPDVVAGVQRVVTVELHILNHWRQARIGGHPLGAYAAIDGTGRVGGLTGGDRAPV